MLDLDVKKNLETEHHYGEDIKEIGFTEIPAVSEALAQSGGLYFIHPLVVNAENNHGYCMPLKEKDLEAYIYRTGDYLSCAGKASDKKCYVFNRYCLCCRDSHNMVTFGKFIAAD